MVVLVVNFVTQGFYSLTKKNNCVGIRYCELTKWTPIRVLTQCENRPSYTIPLHSVWIIL